MSEQKPLPVMTPEEAGIPSLAIEQFIGRLEDRRLCMHSLMVIRYGAIVAEGYWKPFEAKRKHRMYSVTKSFVSIAIGLLEGEGRLTLDDRVTDYFPEKLPEDGVHPYIEAMTIRDLLMMASVHEKTTYKMMKDDDWVKTFFVVPPSHLPGQVFSYDTSATLTLTAIVEKLSGLSLLDYMRPRLLDPIGFSKDAYALKTPLGLTQGGSALICTPRDLAKFALVCMREGNWNGRQLIPKEFIRAATSKQIDTASNPYVDSQQGYGYQFWRCRNNGFVLAGMGGQLSICLPDQELIIVTTADLQPNPDGQQVVCDALWETIYPDLAEGPLAANDDAYRKLEQTIQQLSIVLPEGEHSSTKTTEIHGQTYHFTDNEMGIYQARFEFYGDEGVFEFQNRGGIYRLSFGLGKTIPQKFPIYDYECISAGAWLNERTLELYSYIIDDYVGTFKATIRFGEGTVTMHMRKFAELFLDEFAGFASGTTSFNKSLDK
jgi:CubicO group peptidase (beta-lactamase class C family)